MYKELPWTIYLPLAMIYYLWLIQCHLYSHTFPGLYPDTLMQIIKYILLSFINISQADYLGLNLALIPQIFVIKYIL